ncbi:MAG: MATE family efflux transporter, partial [Candidatus Ornithomonoglobus sp.]
MVTVLCGAVLNILLDPLFIFAFGLGIRGAAAATVISQFVSMLWVLRFLFGKRTILRIRKKYMKLDIRLTKEITGLGIAGFIMNGTNCLVQVVCNVVLSGFGDLYIGIMTVVNSIREIASLPVSGIAYGAQPVMGYNYGAKCPGRVKQSIMFTLVSGFIVSMIFWVSVMAFPRFWMSLFTSDETMISTGLREMRIYYFAFYAMILQFTGQSTFTSLGYAKHAIFFSLFRKAILVVPLTFALPHLFGLGVSGVFAAEPISNVIGGCASFSTMMLTVWRRLSSDEAKNK